jgi:asparagine synthase (glutamine-hydrolysing)
MCGILVLDKDTKDVLSASERLTARGPDATKEVIIDDYLFVFKRLAIMDLEETGMQPFEYDTNVLIANAEIFNYKQIKSELTDYTFKGNSDCEVLLPLYQILKTEMFQFLDGEFAIVLYDKEEQSIIAARDAIGIRPLFYGYDKTTNKILFASEAKALIDNVKKIIPFPPGHFYKDGLFTKFSDLLPVKKFHQDMFFEITQNIESKLKNAVLKRLDSDAPLGFLLSGGLDSSLVCSIAQKHLDKPIRTFSIGMEKDPIDLKYAKEVAEYLGCDHTEVTITKNDVLDSLEDVIYQLETYDITTIRASIGMYLLAKYIHEKTDIKVILTGEVSDELFGYKYTDFAPTAEAFQAESVKRVKELYMYDVLRADRCLASNSLEARVPFADNDFASYVLRISPIFKMNRYRVGKYLLRKAFEKDYLPQHILYREKAAFSDAVGHSLVDYLKEKAETLYTKETFEEKRLLYKPVPISKEALMYREIFDKYYPNHNHLIPDYWMPNKEWDGCQVNDPSARVLKNYGKSGE